MACWSSFFRWARQTKRVTVNPTEELPRFRKPHQRVADVFSDAELEALLALPTVDAAPLAVLLEAGLRKAEARSLQFLRCLPESGRISVIGGKGGRDRIVPMSDRLQRMLADLALVEGLHHSDFVFYRVQANEFTTRRFRDRPVGEGTFARWWRRCLEQAGVRYRKPHTARHTFATNWRRRGLTVDELSILLGHATISTTADIYVHTTVEDVAARMRELELA
jgi:integrase/recombinase XerD